MIKNSEAFVILIILALLMTSCNSNENKTKQKTINKKEMEEEFLEANKKLVSSEAEDISDFLRRYKWDVQETGNGLYYSIYNEGDGGKVETGDLVSIDYKLYFLTGNLVESTEDKEPLTFVVGKSDVISGLQDGILLLHQGDKAKFIIPSHLGYGLVGKSGLIPPKTTLIYDLEVVDLKK